MPKKPYKDYTVGCREEYTDGHDFVQVKARTALEARKLAKTKYRKMLRKETAGEKPHEIYAEYIFPGKVECIYNENGFGMDDAELRKL